MKKFFLAILFSGILFSLSSCIMPCQQTNLIKQQEAQSMYNAFGTSVAKMSPQEAQGLFGCYYRSGDDVYIYSTLWGEKFILARRGQAITYVSPDKSFFK
jgi:hypothetical protein